MYKHLTFIAAAVLALAASSCESSSRLASDIEGTWSGAPTQIANDTAGIVTGTDLLSFTKTGSTEGAVVITSMISVSKPLPGNNPMLQPISYSASAIATAEGTWVATDHDEISITLDQNSIKVEVDRNDLVFETSEFANEDITATDSIKPMLAAALKAQIAADITPLFLNLRHLDDVKVKDNHLKFEVGDHEILMAKDLSKN